MTFKEEDGTVKEMEYLVVTKIVKPGTKIKDSWRTVFDVNGPNGEPLPGPLTAWSGVYNVGDKLYGNVTGKQNGDYFNFTYWPPKEGSDERKRPNQVEQASAILMPQQEPKGLTNIMRFNLAKDILKEMATKDGMFDPSNAEAAKSKYTFWLSWFDNLMEIEPAK